jgi:NADH dehydrogenase FAD-containing subunit
MDAQSARGARKHVVIIGGGFGGLACAMELGNADLEVTVIDRRYKNLFQPLLDQVATAALSPADEGLRDIYALGDTATLQGSDSRLLPGPAQVAKQQGELLGQYLRCGPLQSASPFKFRTRGNTVVIGRNAAVFEFGRWRMRGRLAWLRWAFVHVYLLINVEKRLLVSVQWIARYLTRQRGARIIDEEPTYTTSNSITFPNQQGEQQWTRDRHAS